MKEQRNYIQDLAEIRSMMERSSKFLSLSGLAGVMAGIYALAGVWIANAVLDFNPDSIMYRPAETTGLINVILLAVLILLLSVGTAMFLSYRKAVKRNENAWNLASRQMIANMAIPLSAGGILLFVLLSKGLIGLIAPLTLLFYGLALYSAGKYTYNEIRFLGLIQMGLGLMSSYFIEYSLLLWALGFGVLHIVYGIYMHLRYER